MEEEKELEQFEFCSESDCFWNTDCICYCNRPERDARYGKGCPQYQPD